MSTFGHVAKCLAPPVIQTLKLTKHSSGMLMFITGSRAVGGDRQPIIDALLVHGVLSYIRQSYVKT